MSDILNKENLGTTTQDDAWKAIHVNDYAKKYTKTFGFSVKQKIDFLKKVLQESLLYDVFSPTSLKELTMQLKGYEILYYTYVRAPKMSGLLESKIEYARKFEKFMQNPIHNLQTLLDENGKTVNLWAWLPVTTQEKLKVAFFKSPPELISSLVEKNIDKITADKFIDDEY